MSYEKRTTSMHRLSLFSSILSIKLIACAVTNNTPWLVQEPNGTFDVVCTIKGEVKNGPVAEYLYYVPLPQSSVYQKIEWKTKPPAKLVADVDGTKDRYLRVAGQNVMDVPSLEYAFRITFYRVKVDFAKIGKIFPYDKSREEYKFYTREVRERGKNSSGQMIDWIDMKIPWISQTYKRVWAETKGDTLSYIRKIHELVSEEFEYYADDAPGIHPKNFYQSIESKRGHCGLRHTVFVVLLRAAGIPARTKPCNRPSGSPHVWAEFYLEKYGWIPMNLARKAGDFKRFGVYADHCIVWNNDTRFDVKSPSGKDCRVGQSRGLWSWRGNGGRGKPIFKWEIHGEEIRTPLEFGGTP